MNKKTATGPKKIAQNKKARFDYFIEDKVEAGIALQGWEVKALRAGRIQLVDSYILLKSGEAFLIGGLISPLPTVSTHIKPEPTRTRKLLLHRREIDRLVGARERKGYTIVPLSIYWKKGLAKLEIGTAKGKKEHDKRAVNKERDWNRDKHRILKKG